jgi:hypothetical protein
MTAVIPVESRRTSRIAPPKRLLRSISARGRIDDIRQMPEPPLTGDTSTALTFN